jgi:hypothetical protein
VMVGYDSDARPLGCPHGRFDPRRLPPRFSQADDVSVQHALLVLFRYLIIIIRLNCAFACFARCYATILSYAGMFKTCAIASDDEETRNEGCLQLAKALREVVTAEQDLQAKNAAHEAGVIGKAIVSANAVGSRCCMAVWHVREYASQKIVPINGTAH